MTSSSPAPGSDSAEHVPVDPVDVEPVTVVAVDLGASSGRVMLGRVDATGVRLEEVHRFRNDPVTLWEAGRPTLHWDVAALYAQVLAGLRAATRSLWPGERIRSVGIDSWAVDYGLLGADGALLGVPYCYRDARGADAVDHVHAIAGPAELYARSGLQHLPFNTVFQLAAERSGSRWDAARTMLLLPDLLAYWLTGEVGAEVTNASTTGLLDVRTGRWAVDLAQRLSIPASLLPPLRRPGKPIGTLLAHVAEATGLPADTSVTAVGSHDTASAVVGVPALPGERFAYVACGTWSLVGLELDAPVLSAESRAANFTNEGGVDGRVRYLRNVMGLWLLSESLRTWERAGSPDNLERLLAAAAQEPGSGPVVDPDDVVFLPPGDMPSRIGQACRDAGEPVPATRPALVRCILDSLAAAYGRAVTDAERLSGRRVEVVRVVGGGARNALLCDLTARVTGLPGHAGPVEATALGNVLVQARSLGATGPGLEDLRALLPPPIRSSPATDSARAGKAQASPAPTSPAPTSPAPTSPAPIDLQEIS